MEDKRAIQDSYAIRAAAEQFHVTYYTTLAGARAAVLGMRHMNELNVFDLQGLHASLVAR